MKTTIRQLRSSTKEILSAVNRGNTVWITKRGKPCAKIMPIGASSGSAPADEVFGMWKARKEMRDVRSYVRRLRKWRRAD